MSVVYLIHFDSPYVGGKKAVSHYLGFTTNLPRRLSQHGTSQGAKLMKAVEEAGIGWYVVRTWPTDPYPAGFEMERKLKRQRNHKRFCPACHAQSTDK